MGTDTFNNYTFPSNYSGIVVKNSDGTYTASTGIASTTTLNGTVSPGSTSLTDTNSFTGNSTTYPATAIGDGPNYIIVYVPSEGYGVMYFVAQTSFVTSGTVYTPDTNFGNFNPACYSSGTNILTENGEAAVENLAIGTVVITASGEHRSIKWIGRRSYVGRFLASNPGVQPIRFKAGSLGGGLPHRDLLVSPEHAMFIDGLLIPARCLTNGSSIKQERGMDRVDYFHVELDTHDVILAEGAPSETFVDDDSRAVFHNAADFHQLYPEERQDVTFCAPRIEAGTALEGIRRRLEQHVQQLAA